MRKFILLGIVAMLALAAFVTTALLQGQQAEVAQAGPATVGFDPPNCGVIDGAGVIVAAPNGHVTITNNGQDITIKKSSAKGVANPTGKAVQWDFGNTGFSCDTTAEGGGGSTTKWRNVVSASGYATLTCHFPLRSVTAAASWDYFHCDDYTIDQGSNSSI